MITFKLDYIFGLNFEAGDAFIRFFITEFHIITLTDELVDFLPLSGFPLSHIKPNSNLRAQKINQQKDIYLLSSLLFRV